MQESSTLESLLQHTPNTIYHAPSQSFFHNLSLMNLAFVICSSKQTNPIVSFRVGFHFMNQWFELIIWGHDSMIHL